MVIELMNKYIFILLLFPYISESIENNPCNKLILNSKQKILSLNKNVSNLESSQFFSKSELLSVILPEYVMYDDVVKYIEEKYILFTSNLNLYSCFHTSIGPFQMTPNFMMNCINDSDQNLIVDSLMLIIHNGNKNIIIENIEHFTSVEVQWKILTLFEKIHARNADGDINYLRNIYHSGKKNSYIFTKINCEKKKYKEWSQIFMRFLEY
tara:strand:- start:135 stop:764 length:630 start_codon:yes stop_codon:yes gene_type:complete